MKLITRYKYQNFSTLLVRTVFRVFVFFTVANVFAQKNKDFVIVLDAGHGGKDAGCGGKHGTKYEKDVALNIVLKAGAILEKKENVKVIYTRKKDVFVELSKRGDIANDADADLFVSVHCNANTSAKPFGAETYVLSLKGNAKNFKIAKAENEVILLEDNYEERYKGFDPSNPTSLIGLSLEQEENLDQSLLLASIIQADFEKSLKRYNRGVKQANFWVLHRSYMPSVLIETGFLSNKNEGKFLSGGSGQEKISKSIAQSIYEYYNHQKSNVAVGDDYEGDEITDLSTIIPVENSSDKAYYKVQLATGKNRIRTSSYNFKGIKNVERVKVSGGFYKYFIGDYTTKQEVDKALLLAKSKGYKTAFIVAFNEKENTEEVFETERAEVKLKKETISEVYYKVQIASSSNKISTKSSNFKGLKDVDAVKVGDYYKYYLGKTNSYSQAKEYLASAKSKKYNSAFIVAFFKNERITLKEALKMQIN